MIKEKDLVKYHENIYIVLHIFKSGAIRIYNVNDSTERTLDSESMSKIEKLNKKDLSILPKDILVIKNKIYKVYQNMIKTNYKKEYIDEYVELSKQVISYSPIYTFYTFSQQLKTKNCKLILDSYKIKGIIYYLKSSITYNDLDILSKTYYYLFKLKIINSRLLISYLQKKTYINDTYFLNTNICKKDIGEIGYNLEILEELEIVKNNNEIELLNTITFVFNPTKKKKILNGYLQYIENYFTKRDLKKYLKY